MTLDQSNEHEPKRKPDNYQIDFAKTPLPAALIPLTTQPRWVCWRWEWRKGKGTKGTWTKPPIQPGNGFPAYAKNNDPATWGTFNEAMQRVMQGTADGIGFCLLGSDIAAVDLDHCRDRTNVTAWALDLARKAPENTYCEVTVSGEGLRLIGLGTGPELHRKFPATDGKGSFELYRNTARYITVSGRAVVGATGPLPKIDSLLDRLLAEAQKPASKGNGGLGEGIPERDETGSGYGFRFMQDCHAEGLSYEEACKAILADNTKAGEWANRVDERQLERAWERTKPALDPASPRARLPAELRNMLRLVGIQPVGDYPTRSHLLWAFIHTARRKGIDENEIVAACLDVTYQGCAIYEHIQENGGEDGIKRQIERAINADPLIDEQQRSIIRIEGGKLDELWRAVQRELIDHGCPVYVRGNRLVRPLWRWEKADDRKVLTAQFVPYNVHRLADMVAHHACKFQKYDGRSRKWKDIDPPDTLVERIIEAKHWDFSTIMGIINTPTMRKDGSLLTTEGYDPTTQLWFKSSGDVVLPSIPDNPSKEDAKKALALLDELLEEFPFDGDIARSAALAALITPVLRGALPAAVPLFAIIATEPRSGKTYLVHLIATIATGHTPVPTAGAEKPEEMEKRIETAALSGRPIIHLNNLPNGMVVESEALAQLSTEGMISIRKLGRHEEGLCDCRATTAFLNGNNIVIAADLVPRTVMSRLDPQLERPENRVFKANPIERVRADRGKYLGAVFTIVRAYKAAGCPPQEHKIVAGFEAWSRLVQQPLIWLGEADPYGGMDELRALDPKQEELLEVLEVLKKYFKANAPFTVADCRQRAEETEMRGSPPNTRWQHKRQDLREVMADRFGKVNQRVFGRKLMRHRDRICNGWCIEVVTDSKQARVSVFKLKNTATAQSGAAAAPEALQREAAKAKAKMRGDVVFAAWRDTIGVGETWTTDQVIELAEGYPKLKSALIAVAAKNDGKSISNVRLDRWLRSQTYTFFHGLMLQQKYKDGFCGWTLEAMNQAVGEGNGLFSA
jgi:putative DNA primase/helicase